MISIKGRINVLTLIVSVLLFISLGFNVFFLILTVQSDSCNIDNSILASNDETVDCVVISTPYADLKIPSEYQDSIKTKIDKSDNGCVVEFYGVVSDKELHIYDIQFGDEADKNTGVFIGKDGSKVNYGFDFNDFTEGNNMSADEIDQFSELQETINFVIENLSEQF